MTVAFLREFGTMFTHSVLSGPKTPIREQSWVQVLQHLADYGYGYRWCNGEETWLLQSWVSFTKCFLVQTIPESFEFLKKRLNSYWAGDLSTIKTRYIERNTLDDQWQFYGHWARNKE
ncbi:MAG: hypothetical protein CM15mV139_260 [Caudoviricetes sp.]|nr:MAG: hypothetical protein CM15mV139_260 [Caudoviricetes sp.]